MARYTKRVKILPRDDSIEKLIKELEGEHSVPKGNTCMIHTTQKAILWCPTCGVRLCKECAFVHRLIAANHEASVEQLNISRNPMMPS